MNLSEQQLFLVEFLVDSINVPAVHAVHDEILPATTCVCFQILSLPTITIHQKSPPVSCACDKLQQQIFKKGKSCLFALPSKVLEKPLNTFPISVSVYKKLPPGVLPDVMLIGGAQIQAKDMINEMLKQRVFNARNLDEDFQDTFKISTATGQVVGDITLFLRMSCLGKKIVTQFQIPHNKKPYLFKGPEDSPVFQCKRIPSEVGWSVENKCNCRKGQIKDGAGEATPVVRYIESTPKCVSSKPLSTSQSSATKTNPKLSNSTRLCGCPGKNCSPC
ncbi:microtubule-associated protein 10-like [Prorops nasuta]|uniref:microtubule-associated protein 10-like n=1 Tax=Prorops nasuta TaxID=863751 RepID=UPI0034CDC143